jgi:hypothetical protein
VLPAELKTMNGSFSYQNAGINRQHKKGDRTMIKTHQAPPLVAMRFFKALLFSLFILTLSSAWATSLYVDDDSTALNPDGSEEYPFPTVNDAVQRAMGNGEVDTIVILPECTMRILSL